MKKIWLMAAVILLLFQIPVYAGEIRSNYGDKVSIFENIEVNKSVTGDIVAVLGNVDIDSDVNGDVVAVLGNVRVNARVSGDVVSVLGEVTLTDKAEIRGGLVSVGKIQKSAESKVYGQEVPINLGFLSGSYFNAIMIILIIIFSFFTFIIGTITILITKNKFLNISSSIGQRMGRKILIGFLVFMGCTIFSPFLAITVIGPLIYGIILMIAEVISCVYFGKLIMGGRSNNTFLEFFTGFTVVTLVNILPLIFIPQSEYKALILWGIFYALFKLFIYSLGLGVIIDSKFGFSDTYSSLKTDGGTPRGSSQKEWIDFDSSMDPGDFKESDGDSRS